MEWIALSSPGDLSSPGIDPKSPGQAGSLLLSHQGSPLLTTLDTYCHLFMVEKTKAQTGYGLILYHCATSEAQSSRSIVVQWLSHV